MCAQSLIKEKNSSGIVLFVDERVGVISFGITFKVCEGEKPSSVDSEVFDIRPSFGW